MPQHKFLYPAIQGKFAAMRAIRLACNSLFPIISEPDEIKLRVDNILRIAP
jgi:hypothetical protein